MQDTERERTSVKTAKPVFDESKLTQPQRKALDIARAQGVKPIHSLKDLKLDLPHEELEAYADTLDQIRQEARQHPRKNHF